jgi:hypothetical protein
MNLTTRIWICFVALTSVLVIFTSAVFAQPLEGYGNYEAFSSAVKELAKSNLVTVESLGTTLGGRELTLLKVTKGSSGDDKACLCAAVGGRRIGDANCAAACCQAG